ncbi:alpha-amylase [Sulfurifustis variabilis]|uniref:Maltokinase n=1 Tax=Sulfurifustis variabilis TaxID=1675686 RepID=A0A1B4V3C5_9GAMM|nr:maltose alpha-D-glucosyltransferase [Sulfurifustis variabilis]BAU48059.1 alpha-amylase [Sulfurifustis variabilis]
MARESKGGQLVIDPLWYKDAILYELHVKAFFDSNGDGIGDFAGLTAKLDYLQDLGVNTLWLLPFYPSPLKDDGYDIADYRRIHKDYGSRRDFRTFIREAHRRGLRVVTELVINHTSDEHSWFQSARRAPRGSMKRNYYVWSDSDKKYAGARIIFLDTEKSNWAWDPVAQQYYWHRFFSHQPDLNFDNPHVVRAVTRVMQYWLNMGVDGLRLDAIPYLCEREGTSCENLPETHAVLKKLRAALDKRYPDRMFLAEANQWPEDVRDYFGASDECHMAYHFPLMPRMYMAIAQEDRHPIIEILQQTPDIPDDCQWAIFLRNHDELTLEMVTSKERDYMWQMYAADPRARLNLGIRRRLAPLLDNDLDRIKLMNSLLFSMPGSPIIYYGDEIGMGDNIYLGDRNGVRTPMQWSPDRNAGFSRADPQRLYLPPIMDPIYGYEAVNVEAQARDPSSLLNWMKRLLSVRKSHQAFGRGRLVFLRPGNRKILAFLREHGEDAILCVANLARSAQPVELDLSRYKGRVPVELLGRAAFPPIGELPYLLTMPSHGFYWFRLAKGEEVPSWHEERLAPEDLPMLVLFDGWHSFFRDRVVPWRIAMAEKVRGQLEEEALPRFVGAQRWYAAKGEPIARLTLTDRALWEEGGASWLIALFRLEGGAEPAHYFLPMSLVWEEGDEERLRGVLPATVARVRQQAQIGVLADAFADEVFCRAVVNAIERGLELPSANGVVRFSATRAYAELAEPDAGPLPVRAGTQGTNTSVTIGSRLFLKAYRRLRVGLNPELEVGRYLTEVARYPNTVPLAGSVEYQAADGTVMTLALLQGYVENQGDGWNYTLDYLERFLEQCRTGTQPPGSAEDIHGAYLALARTLGLRTAELHAAFTLTAGGPDFDPEAIGSDDLTAWAGQVRHEAETTLELIAQRLAGLPGDVRAEGEWLVSRRGELLDRIRGSTPAALSGLKTRYHGDYHLGQVLVSHNDFIIIDFEGEPARPLAERRQKHSPLRDVAGMLRSFNYAAYSALARLTAERPDDFPRLEPFARAWEGETERAFLQAYEEGVAGSPLYRDWAQARDLLALFVIEKALYEVRYELHNRPEWAGIPLRGLRELMGHS